MSNGVDNFQVIFRGCYDLMWDAYPRWCRLPHYLVLWAGMSSAEFDVIIQGSFGAKTKSKTSSHKNWRTYGGHWGLPNFIALVKNVLSGDEKIKAR